MDIVFFTIVGIVVIFCFVGFIAKVRTSDEDKTEQNSTAIEKEPISLTKNRRISAVPEHAVKTLTSQKNKTAPQSRKGGTAPRIGLSKNIAARTAHTHPLEQGAEYRVERVDMGGSLGGELTEGCPDQYFQRLVKINDRDTTDSEPNYELIKTIVYGEMLNRPKYKKR